jgi:hypothetical protein
MHELNARVAHLLEICKNRDPFTGEELWQKHWHTRGPGVDMSRLSCRCRLYPAQVRSLTSSPIQRHASGDWC